jgi:uncharacterized protein (TIGR02594 family)
MKGIDVMKSHYGLEEVKDRKVLMQFLEEYAHNNDIVVDPSTTPWCACMMNACERAAGNKGTGKQNARSFLDYGTKIEPRFMQEGDILIFKRGNSNWQGHVTYYAGKKDEYGNLLCIGGNQSDKVCYSWHSPNNLIGVRRS